MAERPRTATRPPSGPQGSRALPLSIAAICCLLLSLVLGYTWWLLLGTSRRATSVNNGDVVQTSPVVVPDQVPAPTVEATSQPSPAPSPETEPPAAEPPHAPAGELPVPAGVAMLGGEGTGQPLRRESVEPFAIAETEVTNEQYNEFVKETGHRPPGGWSNGEYPSAIPNNPVTGVTWQDAVAYCEWLSKKIGATVRLPSEKEWVLAAAGAQNFKYPWGNEWNQRAANYRGSRGGMIVAVKSYPDFKSPCGAYDMAGNVWEWVSDDALDAGGRQLMSDRVVNKILKGGSAGVRPEYLTNNARLHLPLNERNPWVGFRYVVVRDGAAR